MAARRDSAPYAALAAYVFSAPETLTTHRQGGQGWHRPRAGFEECFWFWERGAAGRERVRAPDGGISQHLYLTSLCVFHVSVVPQRRMHHREAQGTEEPSEDKLLLPHVSL